MKPLTILRQNIAPMSHDFSSQSRKSNGKSSILFFFFFFSIKHIQMIHTPNQCSTIRYLPFLGQSCMQAACKLHGPKHASWWLTYTPFCVELHAQLYNYRWYKDVLPIERLLSYWRYLFSLLELYARYDWRVMNPNTKRNHFSIHHLCVLTLVTRKLQIVC